MLGHTFSRKELDLMAEMHETAIEDLTERLAALEEKLGLAYNGDKYIKRAKRKTNTKTAKTAKTPAKRPVGRPRKNAD